MQHYNFELTPSFKLQPWSGKVVSVYRIIGGGGGSPRGGTIVSGARANQERQEHNLYKIVN